MKLTKAQRLAKKKQAKADRAAKALASRKVVKSKLSKKQLAEKRAKFSLTHYLKKKAVDRAAKLQYRQAKRNGTLEEAHDHEHHHHDHAHEEETLEVHEQE